MSKLFNLSMFVLLLSACAQAPVNNKTQMDRKKESTPFTLSYRCSSGDKIIATHVTDTQLLLEYRGQVMQLARAVSASGVRYTGADFTWHTKGDKAMLSRGVNEAEMRLESCVEN